MSEPWREAEEIESEWDRKCASAPRCDECGGSVYPYDVFLEYRGLVLCQKCLGAAIRNIEDLEV